MKQFKDLKIGDVVYIGLEKKIIADITQDDYFKRVLHIYTNDGEAYIVKDNSSYSFDVGEDSLISADKDAIIKHCTDELRNLQLYYVEHKSYFEKIIEEAKELK